MINERDDQLDQLDQLQDIQDSEMIDKLAEDNDKGTAGQVVKIIAASAPLKAASPTADAPADDGNYAATPLGCAWKSQ